MNPRLEEEPDEEPDDPQQPARPGDGAAPARLIPTVGLPSRDWEYSTRVMTVAEVADGSTLVKVLQDSGAEGWDLADIIDAGDKRVLLMRRTKRPNPETRRVGFAPPSHD